MNALDNTASFVGATGARGPMHQAERMEGKKREEEVCCPWRGPGQGYIVQSGQW